MARQHETTVGVQQVEGRQGEASRLQAGRQHLVDRQRIVEALGQRGGERAQHRDRRRLRRAPLGQARVDPGLALELRDHPVDVLLAQLTGVTDRRPRRLAPKRRQVLQHEVGALAGSQGQRRAAVGGLQHVVRRRPQRDPQQLAGDLVVLDNENLHSRG
jgi:hypothetical protein